MAARTEVSHPASTSAGVRRTSAGPPAGRRGAAHGRRACAAGRRVRSHAASYPAEPAGGSCDSRPRRRSSVASARSCWRCSPWRTSRACGVPERAVVTNSSTSVVGGRRRDAERVDLEDTVGRVDLDPRSGGLESAVGGERRLAHRAVLMVEQEPDPAVGVAVGPDADHPAECGLEQVDHVGTEVEERALLEAPGGGERTAQHAAGQEPPPAADRPPVGDGLEQCADRRARSATSAPSGSGPRSPRRSRRGDRQRPGRAPAASPAAAPCRPAPPDRRVRPGRRGARRTPPPRPRRGTGRRSRGPPPRSTSATSAAASSRRAHTAVSSVAGCAATIGTWKSAGPRARPRPRPTRRGPAVGSAAWGVNRRRPGAARRSVRRPPAGPVR